METLFSTLLARLDTVTGLATVDIDWGQLEAQNPDDGGYVVNFPCALLDVSDISWTQSGTQVQPGAAYIRIKVGINLLYDTGKNAPKRADAIARIGMAKTVHDVVNLYTDGKFGKLIRSRTRVYNVPGGIKVVELEYQSDFIG